MTPQEDSKPGRTRREGNITYLRTEFAARLRFLVLWEARQQARQAVIRRIRAEGKVKVSLMSASEITSLAKEHLRANAAALLAAAEASGTVRNLSSSGSLPTLAAMRRAGLIASELGPRQRLPAHGEKMLLCKAQ